MELYVLLSLFTGIFAGIVHVLSGPDHLAAISPLTLQKQNRYWHCGFAWGIGHAGGIWVITVPVFLFQDFLPLGPLSSWSERLVGVVLILLGVSGVRQVLHSRKNSPAPNDIRKQTQHRHRGFRKALTTPVSIGLIHGMAGSAHLLGILPALVLPTFAATIAYLIGFSAGGIAAMSMFSWAVGNLSERLAGDNTISWRWLRLGFSSLAMIVGVAWITVS